MTQTPHEARRERIALQVRLAMQDEMLVGSSHAGVSYRIKRALEAADSILADDPALALMEALAKRAYLMSEPHLSGHRVVLGFEAADDAMAAHTALAAYQSTDKGDAE